MSDKTDMIRRADAPEVIALAAALWREQAVDVGAPPSVAAKRTLEEFVNQVSEVQSTFLKYARCAIRTLPAAQVAVKPLEWRHVAPHGLYEAYGLCWKYQIRVGTDGIIRWQAGHMGAWFDADSVDAAKAAAQADYETRIRSALTVAPAQVADPAQIRADALREVLALVRGYLDAWDDTDINGSSISIIYDAILALIDTLPAVSDDVAALVEAVAAERERCISAVRGKITTLEIVIDSMKEVGGHKDAVWLAGAKVEAMQEAIAAIRWQS